MTDVVVVAGVVLFGQLLRFGSVGTTSSLPGFAYGDYTVVSVVIATAWVIALAAYRTRSTSVIGAGLEEYRRVWRVRAWDHGW